MKAGFLFAFVALFAALAQACGEGEDNYLKGSITDSYDMSFDETRARLYESELAIEYVKDSEGGGKVALRIALGLAGGPPAKGRVYDLLTEGTITRGSGLGGELPELESGDLELLEYSAADDSAVQGDFEAVFVTEDNTRQTLRGAFSTKLELVN